MQQFTRRFLTSLVHGRRRGSRSRSVGRGREGALETTTVRIFANRPGICVAPQYIAEPLLHAEGFNDVRFVGLTATTGAPAAEAVGLRRRRFHRELCRTSGHRDRWRRAITLLSGVHVGCFELFGNEGVRSITDLKGKSVGVQGLGSSQHVYAASMAAYVGLDPTKDIHWAINPAVEPTELYEKGQIDAFLGFPPEPQELRVRHVGHVVVNSADRPALVAVLLLHARWQPRVCPQISGCDQASAARHP